MQASIAWGRWRGSRRGRCSNGLPGGSFLGRSQDMARPLFVVSAPRSGSTFSVQLLNAHARVKLVNELNFVPYLRRMFLLASTPAGEQITDHQGFETPAIMTARYAWDFAHAFLDSMQPFIEDLFDRVAEGVQDAAFYGDKVTSVPDLQFLIERFPEPAFVQLIRDPRDVIASTFAFQKKQAMHWDASTFETRVEHLARFLDESDRLLEGRETHRVRYEDLVKAPKQHAREIFDFLGLDLSTDVESYLKGAADELFESHGTSRSPAQSIGRWRRDFTPEQQDQANAGLAQQLKRLGYQG